MQALKPWDGPSERFVEQDGQLIVAREQTGIARHVDYCRARQNEGYHGPSSDFKLVGSIPVVVVEHYINVHGITLREFDRNPEHMKRILNSPEFSDFRIAPGRV